MQSEKEKTISKYLKNFKKNLKGLRGKENINMFYGTIGITSTLMIRDLEDEESLKKPSFDTLIWLAHKKKCSLDKLLDFNV